MSGQLIIKPISAQLTYNTEWFGKMDCYCKITVGGNVFKTNPAHDQGKHPNWQQSFTAMVNGDQVMHVAVYDHDNVTVDDYVGECQVPLQDIYNRRNSSNWYTLMRKGKSSGQIMIILEFYPGGGMGGNMGGGYGGNMGGGYGGNMGGGNMGGGYGGNMGRGYGNY